MAAMQRISPFHRTVRIAVSGLARAGKTSFLTSVAANAFAGRLRPGAGWTVKESPAGASNMARFDARAHLAALAADPPHWPDRTANVSLLSLDITLQPGGRLRPARTLKLELLDYPGEWLLDLPLLKQRFADWSGAVLARLEQLPEAQQFLDFTRAISYGAGADEALAEDGHRRYRRLLGQLSEELRLSMLQPGRFLLPFGPAEPPWMRFFPCDRGGALGKLLASRYDAYVRAVREELAGPAFARIDRLVVLADVLAALHAGPAAFADARDALGTVAEGLRWRQAPGFMPERVAALLPLAGIRRVAFVASKADHVAEQQRGNLAELVAAMTSTGGQAKAASFAIAAVRCTEDYVLTLDGRAVSGVRGKVAGTGTVAFYPGEVPRRPPGPEFWTHPFLQVPKFMPAQLAGTLAGGVQYIDLDRLFAFLLEDVL